MHVPVVWLRSDILIRIVGPLPAPIRRRRSSRKRPRCLTSVRAYRQRVIVQPRVSQPRIDGHYNYVYKYFQFINKYIKFGIMVIVGNGISNAGPTNYSFSRWSSSRLNTGTNSNATSPSSSARSSFNHKQPYLGWRSQEKLSKPRTPAERLAAGLLPQKNQVSSNAAVTNHQK